MKQLRSFIAVVDYGSFTKAAEKTYTSQPTVSAHIKALEEELGVQLIARDTKNLRVTQKGKELYDCACGMLALQQRMLDKWEDEDRKVLSIGVSTIPSGYILPPLLEGFRKEFPDVVISIHQSDSEEIEDAVEKGTCDVGLVGEEPGAGLLSVPIAEDKTVLIAPDMPAFRKMVKAKDWKKLLAQPMLFREKGSASRKSAEKLIELLGKDLRDLDVAASLNDQEAIKNLVEHGFGISFLSALAATDRAKAGRLLVLDTGLPEAKRTFYLIRRKNVQLSESAENFIKFIQK
ncbi:MAG: LysR family transcriptional regulator [Firmicutes bacterium]|nr:LysR family transcriptional regulator [Bacillota bacterium]